MLHANKIDEIQNILLDNKFLAMIRNHYDSLYSCAKKTYPNLKFYLDGRRKSVIGSEKKINLYLLQDRDLADFKDELAFRFIVFDNNIETCYSLMKTVIEFNISEGFIPCKATSVFQTEGFEKQNFPDVTIPEKSFLPSNYQLWVKDYILHPKASGYQSLHVVFRIQRPVDVLKSRLELSKCIFMQKVIHLQGTMHTRSSVTLIQKLNLIVQKFIWMVMHLLKISSLIL